MASPLTGAPDGWSRVAKDYRRYIVPDFLPAARRLCHEARIGPGDAVLDIACGPGTATFIAGELGAVPVVGVDFARGMVSLAHQQGCPDGAIHFSVGDAVLLPFASGRFDVVVSSFGLVFAPEPARAAAEAARVLKRGGRLGLLAWAADGTVAAYQRAAFQYFDMSAAAHDPFQWGVAAQARRWLDQFGEVETLPIEVPFRAESAGAAWRVLRTATGRISASYATLDAGSKARLDADMTDFFDPFRRASGAIYWPREAFVIRGVRR